MSTTTSTNGATGSSGIWQLFKERRTRGALYGASSYWDSRASARQGMARSLWPSNVYNALWDERQRELIARTLGDVTGRKMLDVGSGTGRVTRWLAEQRGARGVVGVDFSQTTVEAAGTPVLRSPATDAADAASQNTPSSEARKR